MTMIEHTIIGRVSCVQTHCVTCIPGACFEADIKHVHYTSLVLSMLIIEGEALWSKQHQWLVSEFPVSFA